MLAHKLRKRVMAYRSELGTRVSGRRRIYIYITHTPNPTYGRRFLKKGDLRLNHIYIRWIRAFQDRVQENNR